MSSPDHHSSTLPTWHSVHGALRRLLSHTMALVRTLAGLNRSRPGVHCSRTGAIHMLGAGAALLLEEAQRRTAQVTAVATRTTAGVLLQHKGGQPKENPPRVGDCEALEELERRRGAARRVLSKCITAAERLMDKLQRPTQAVEWGVHTGG
ncbi:uncharacterized protein TM35_000262110 [Trypanosoma theileri]|uniref:Uncharacterized protein n=1 Tax=Trypanosoma theileri TaxID=67003 RepID=A0A1X0NRF4_9TRYP|nr:uncharacterized protein TM35_000262110 [Trypanosoma theileri]ORC86759.1 hypothetical protein TM35_000262110 [Trypanosoma theileri]